MAYGNIIPELFLNSNDLFLSPGGPPQSWVESQTVMLTDPTLRPLIRSMKGQVLHLSVVIGCSEKEEEVTVCVCSSLKL